MVLKGSFICTGVFHLPGTHVRKFSPTRPTVAWRPSLFHRQGDRQDTGFSPAQGSLPAGWAAPDRAFHARLGVTWDEPQEALGLSPLCPAVIYPFICPLVVERGMCPWARGVSQANPLLSSCGAHRQVTTPTRWRTSKEVKGRGQPWRRSRGDGVGP